MAATVVLVAGVVCVMQGPMASLIMAAGEVEQAVIPATVVMAVLVLRPPNPALVVAAGAGVHPLT